MKVSHIIPPSPWKSIFCSKRLWRISFSLSQCFLNKCIYCTVYLYMHVKYYINIFLHVVVVIWSCPIIWIFHLPDRLQSWPVWIILHSTLIHLSFEKLVHLGSSIYDYTHPLYFLKINDIWINSYSILTPYYERLNTLVRFEISHMLLCSFRRKLWIFQGLI